MWTQGLVAYRPKARFTFPEPFDMQYTIALQVGSLGGLIRLQPTMKNLFRAYLKLLKTRYKAVQSGLLVKAQKNPNATSGVKHLRSRDIAQPSEVGKKQPDIREGCETTVTKRSNAVVTFRLNSTYARAFPRLLSFVVLAIYNLARKVNIIPIRLPNP